MEVFVDPTTVALREGALATGGLLSGKELAGAFAALRPRELVWNYVSHGYLEGHAPRGFDLLYWNADSTNLPGPMYCWYLRNMYLENSLRKPGVLRSLDQAVDLTLLDMPTYLVATREDHIVPWRSAFASIGLVSGATRFVLGASGHIAGIVNPPAQGRRSFWCIDEDGVNPPPHAEQWLAAATEVPGSWWTDWSTWLSCFKGRAVPARARPGNAQYRPLGPAPGEYVKVRV